MISAFLLPRIWGKKLNNFPIAIVRNYFYSVLQLVANNSQLISGEGESPTTNLEHWQHEEVEEDYGASSGSLV
ncbi:MAG: hypothetical protein Fur0025_20100 [Oscillatoriaceae cyanobacterium]